MKNYLSFLIVAAIASPVLAGGCGSTTSTRDGGTAGSGGGAGGGGAAGTGAGGAAGGSIITGRQSICSCG